MKIALFIPCLVNHFAPQVGVATVELLEKLGHQVIYPQGQTCCGQPMTNSGCYDDAKSTTLKLLNSFKGVDCDYIVCPSASCLLAAKQNFHQFDFSPEATKVIGKLMELTEFLHDIQQLERFVLPVEKRVSLHLSCAGLRKLNLATPSEHHGTYFSKVEALLDRIEGLDLAYPERRDECCGFGGTFAMEEGAVSAKMGKDKAKAHLDTGAQFIVGYDPSCLLHLDGLCRREGYKIKTMHLAELINQAL